MAQFDIFIDVYKGITVTGLSNPQAVDLPILYQGDDPTLRIWLLNPTGIAATPYTYLDTTGLTLQVAVGQKKGTGGIVYTSQLTWALNTDPTKPFFSAQLPMNTTPINTAIGSSAAVTDGFFQVVYLQSGVQTTVLEVAAPINASVIQNGGVIVPPGLTPVSQQYADSTYLARTIAGTVVWKNTNTGKLVAQYLGDDGELHWDPLN